MDLYTDDHAALQRLRDLEREMESGRLWASGIGTMLTWATRLGRRGWVLAGLAAQRPPRRRAGAAVRQLNRP